MVACDMEDAVQIAEEFLGERHSTMNLESSSLKDDTWYLVFDVGFLSQHLKEIRINARSGKIVRYASIGTDNEDGD